MISSFCNEERFEDRTDKYRIALAWEAIHSFERYPFQTFGRNGQRFLDHYWIDEKQGYVQTCVEFVCNTCLTRVELMFQNAWIMVTHGAERIKDSKNHKKLRKI